MPRQSSAFSHSATNEVKKNRGYLSMPNPSNPLISLKGSHAVLIVGYDDQTGHFIVRNSWGSDWVCIQM
jgi:C1A family cysteine protease